MMPNTRMLLLVIATVALAGWRVAVTTVDGLLLVSFAQQFEAAQSSPKQTQEPQPARRPEFVGVERCALCHDQSTKSNPLLSREFCLLTETAVFREEDKHAQAYQLLKSELGRRMSEGLGYEVTEARQCLSCHADWRWKEGSPKPSSFDYGVTCEACHGPGSLWVDPHYKKEWRAKPIAEKEKLGMVDVRNPLRRARQCLSCHVGNVAEGKVITHEMYAAGHPPLPGIEIETFASQMPPHWRSLREKGEFDLRQEFLAAGGAGLEQNAATDLPRTKAVIVGGVTALRESLALAADQALENESANWPELAVFDCQACHHDLRSAGWRQRRGYGGGKPGRPQLPVWPTALVRLSLRHLAKDDNAVFQAGVRDFEGKLKKLRDAFDARPFGKPDEIQAAVYGNDGLIPWLDDLGEKLLKSPFREADAKRAVRLLCENETSEYADYASARQIAWALKALLAETERNAKFPAFAAKPESESREERKAREERDLAAWQRWKETVRRPAEERIDKLFDQLELNDRLILKLPAGTQRRIVDELPKSLEASSDYDPAWFQQQLQELSRVMNR